MSQEDFVKKVFDKKPTVEVLSEYKGQDQKVLFKCKICGHEWEAQARSMLRGLSGCRKCAGSYSYSNEEFLQKLEKINPDIEPLDKYTKNNVKIRLKCKKCGYVWTTTPNKLLSSKTGCSKCAGQVKMKTEDLREKLKEWNPNIVLLGEFGGVDVKTQVKCKICGNVWESTPSHLKERRGCPICARKYLTSLYVKSKEKFIEEMKKIDPTIEIIGEYVNNRTKIKCRCKDCGNEWEATPSNLLKYRGCPACSASKGEKFIAYYLKENNIAFIPQKRFDDCKDKRALSFDFYLPSFNICIEFDGQQHFSPDIYFGESEEKAKEDFERLKRRDNIKNNYCAKNNITLIRIPYWEVNNISVLLDKIFNKGRI